MRIAVIAPPWYPVPPSGYGGIEWVVSLLADGLTERGHDVTLFATTDSLTAGKLHGTAARGWSEDPTIDAKVAEREQAQDDERHHEHRREHRPPDAEL